MAVSYDGLVMGVKEYFDLPIPMRELMLENQKEIAERKSNRMQEITGQ